MEMEIIDIFAFNPTLVISLVLSIAAFFVSALTLYYHFLKDADIVLINPLQFSMNRLKKPEEVLYIENSVTFHTYLVFLNSGARSGSIRVKLNVRPTEDVKPFYETYQAHRVLHEQSEMAVHWEKLENEFFLVKGQDSYVLYAEIKIELRDWKAVLNRLDPNTEAEWCDELCRVDFDNKMHLQEFRNALREGERLATVSIDVTQPRAGRTWLLKQTLKERQKSTSTISIGSIDRDFIALFDFGLKNWDNIKPTTILDSFTKIDEWLSELLSLLKDQISKLKPLTMQSNLDADFCLDSILIKWNEITKNAPEEKSIVDFILEKVGLKSKLEDLDAYTQTLDNTLNSHNTKKESSKSLQDVKALVETLIRDNPSIQKKLRELQKELEVCHKKIADKRELIK
jgi:hypothetical protein